MDNSKPAKQDTPPLTDEQRVELDRRLDAYEKDKIKGREASDVVKTLKKRHEVYACQQTALEQSDR